MEPISSSNKMVLLLVAADGVGGQLSMGATVHPGAMQRRSTWRRMPRVAHAEVLACSVPQAPPPKTIMTGNLKPPRHPTSAWDFWIGLCRFLFHLAAQALEGATDRSLHYFYRVKPSNGVM